MRKTFKVLSLLLSYPTTEIKASAADLRAALREDGLLPERRLREVEAVIDEFETADLFDLQERYVFLFDRTRSLSLHLFEHVHGESRDRGQAMVDLKSLYAQKGLAAGARELPDFLPLFLEYLSHLPRADAQTLLAEPVSVIAALRERLQKRRSVYAGLFSALETLAVAAPAQAALEELRRTPDDDPSDLEALDAAWEDRPVLFGPESGGCPKADDLLRRMRDESASNQARS